MVQPTIAQIRAVVAVALAEDLALGDVTTAALFPDPLPARATVLAKEPLVVAGVAVAREVFRQVDPALCVVRTVADGAEARAGARLMVIEGDARALLAAERVALNFLQRLSGVATLTARYCEAVRGYRTRILDTRKTTPGLRALEKWAVALGGGRNHRRCLGDGVLIKDNHLALARGLTLAEVCRRARHEAPHGLSIIVEAETLTQVKQALDGRADVILLDNMPADLVRQAVHLIKGRAVVEVSGGMTLETVREYAAAGADAISIGQLTHSARAVDLSLDLTPIPSSKVRRPHGG